MSNKFVIYKRLSKENKGKAQHGFNSQMLDIQYYLETVSNSEIIGEYQEFVSGGADVKPELEKAMEHCRKEGATLLIAKLDRLSRRVSQIACAMEGDVKFKVSTMPSANNLQLHLYAMLAEEERTNIRNRVKRGLEAAKAKGIKLGGASEVWKTNFQKNKAAGLHKKTKEYSAARENRVLIAKAISSFVKTVQSVNRDEKGIKLVDIATHLNNNKFKTPRGGMFAANSVGRLVEEFKINRVNGHMVVNV
ncbi:putative resolvase [Vibrio phage 277E43-1]|nr:putative resolvase [Vibrio phage 277E43-1]